MWQDLLFGLKMMRARPGFTAVAIVTLALGIGANTAIFSIVDAVVLRPLPYRDPQRLFFVAPTNPKDGDRERRATLAEVQLLRDQLRSFAGLAVAAGPWDQVVTDGAESAAVSVTYASANLLDVLGVAPAQGRGFLPEEDVVGGPPAAVLTHASWQRRFAGDPGVVGRTLVVEGALTRIVGVLPPAVSFPGSSSELWLPLARSARAMHFRHLHVVGRLASGVAEAQARAELSAVAPRLEAAFPEINAGVGLRMVQLHDHLTRQVRPTLWLLLGAVALVLLIACANVANLMLARGLARNGEMAVRSALGAGRGRLLRLLLTEGLLLALAGGAAGALLAHWGVELAMKLSPVALPGEGRIAVDSGVLAFTLAISLLTGVAFSIAPAWRAIGVSPQLALREGSRGSTSTLGQRRLSGGLVIAEMALAMVLLVGAGLLLRTMGRILDVDPGFATRNLLTLQLSVPSVGYEDMARRAQLYRQIEEQLGRLPGVTSVGIVRFLPLAAAPGSIFQALDIQGRPVARANQPEIEINRATSSYFQAMGIPLSRGRLISAVDTNLAVINEAAARRFWPDQDPLGKMVRISGSSNQPSPWHTIVGIVGNVRHLGLDIEPRSEIFFQLGLWEPAQHVVVRTTSDPATLTTPVRLAIAGIDPGVAVSHLHTMDTLVRGSTAQRRFGMLLLTVFAVFALILAAIGLYGVMSYAVAQRKRELGLRMALGAQSGDVSRMVVRQGLSLVLIGAALGLAGALALTRLISTFLYGVTATDPPTLIAVSLLLLAVALLACYLPARRATRLDPMIALRHG
jgi:putative ABC transport system permease protein